MSRVLEWLPSWSSNRLKRLVRVPKRHLIDPALAAAALRLDVDAILRDGFVTAQIRALRWLKGELGERFVLGIVLHTGPRRYELEERIVAAPIGALWA